MTTAHVGGRESQVPSAGHGRRRGHWFADRPVNTKILMALFMVTLVSIVMCVIGYLQLANTAQKAEDLYKEYVVPDKNVSLVHQQEIKVRMDFMAHAAQTDAEGWDAWEKDIADDEAELDQNAAAYRKATGNTDLDAFTTKWDQVRTLYKQKLLPLARTGNLKQWNAVYDAEIRPVISEAADALDAMEAQRTKEAAQYAQEAQDAKASGQRLMIIALALGLVLAITLALIVARMISRPLRKVADVLDGVAAGDLTRRVDVDSKDEVGQIARSLNHATESMHTSVLTIDGSSNSLATASEHLNTVGGQISSSAQEASSQSGAVAAGAEEVSGNIQTMSAAAEEMGASIREIAHNASEAAKVAAQAVTAAEATNETVAKLGTSSAEISGVIKLITSIAEQTNLLALNATIEAARAGDAGKGFAVVAGEVKDLALETAKATEDISHRIEAIQADSESAVAAIGEIGEIIAKINDYQTTIASAVEEQTATTGEMNRNVTESASGAKEIATNIGVVAEATRVTTDAVGESQRAVQELAQMSAELRALVSNFRV